MSVNRINSTGTTAATSASRSAGSGSAAGFADTLSSIQNQSGSDLESIFEAAAKKYNIPVTLLKAVAKVESNFHANATSRCGAMGIMQLMPRTAKYLGVTDAYDPEQNIMGGAKYLRQLLNEFGGDTRVALAAYNAGPGTVKKYGGVPSFGEGYVNKVMGYYNGDSTLATTTGLSAASSASDDALSEAMADAIDDRSTEGLSNMLLASIRQIGLLESTDDQKDEQNGSSGLFQKQE
jgi:hypothetical protein